MSKVELTKGNLRTAARVCVACRANKRKCNKLIDGCDVCKKAGRICHYTGPRMYDEEGKDLRRKFARLERNAVSCSVNSNGHTPLEAPNNDKPFSLHSTSLSTLLDKRGFAHPWLRQSLLNNAVTAEVLGELQDRSLQYEAEKYFDTVNLFMPFISKEPYFERLADLASTPSAEIAILAISMHLVVQLPGSHSSEGMRTLTYALTKSLFGFIEAAGILSIRTIQAGILLTFYELGHGLTNAAENSISYCVNSSRALQLSEAFSSNSPERQQWKPQEEMRRTWWAIFVLDRYANLQQQRARFAAEDPSLDFALPCDEHIWDHNIEPSHETLLSVSSSVRVGPFARLTQVSHLLGKVLRHAYDPTFDRNFNAAEAMTLKYTLQVFRTVVPQEIDSCARYCGVIGLCNSASLLLQNSVTSDPRGKVSEQTAKADSLNLAAMEVADIAANFNQLITCGHLRMEELSPFVSHSLYQAMVAQSLTIGQKNSDEPIESFTALMEMLQVFTERWKCGGTSNWQRGKLALTLDAERYLRRLEFVQ